MPKLRFVSKGTLTASVLGFVVSLGAGACAGGQASTAPPPQQPYPPPAYGPPPGQPGQPPPPYGQPYPYPPPPARPPPQVQRPLLPPLVGTPAMQQEVVNVLQELIRALPPQRQQLVRGIPLTFDPTLEVNAFAGCDEAGKPFLAATAGMLEAVDAIAQTKATDELFGTRTYDAYTNAVLPQMVKSPNARAALPSGIIPPNHGGDARRWSRAHELFDDVIAFTFGHELAHHYLGHTGCAKGQPMGNAPDPSRLGRLLSVVPLFNQANEAASDSAGVVNALDAGRARRPQYEWSDMGGLLLLDYFARLEGAAGAGSSFLGLLLNNNPFLRTHPNPLARIPGVQFVANSWRGQHPR